MGLTKLPLQSGDNVPSAYCCLSFGGHALMVRTPTQLLKLAVSASPPIWLLLLIPRMYTAPHSCIQAMRRRMLSFCEKCPDSGRLRWEIEHLYIDTAEEWFCKLEINEVKGTSGSKDHSPTVEALSIVQHCWLQPCPRQDHPHLGCSDAWAAVKAAKEMKKLRNS